MDGGIVNSSSDWMEGLHCFSHDAMATVFEIRVLHPEPSYAEQAAWAAFEELDRLESELSRFVPNSDVSRINGLEPGQSARTGLDVINCLQLCATISAETNGAFDVTVGGFSDRRQHESDRESLTGGWDSIEIDKAHFTVARNNPRREVDLGGVGKGYAIDQVSALLRDWDIDAALIHGGFSTVMALDRPLGTEGWPMTISHPVTGRVLRHFHLENQALSGSGLFKGQHIIDPRTLEPVHGSRAAWSCTTDAALSDALSTAFMVMTPDEIRHYCEHHPGIQAAVLLDPESGQSSEEGALVWAGF